MHAYRLHPSIMIIRTTHSDDVIRNLPPTLRSKLLTYCLRDGAIARDDLLKVSECCKRQVVINFYLLKLQLPNEKIATQSESETWPRKLGQVITNIRSLILLVNRGDSFLDCLQSIFFSLLTNANINQYDS